MGLSKWIKDRAIHGRPAFSWEDVRKAGLYASEQVLKNELLRLCNNKTIGIAHMAVLMKKCIIDFHLNLQ